jgi:cathepsin B
MMLMSSFLVSLASVWAFSTEGTQPLTDDALVNQINSLGLWVAGDYFANRLFPADLRNLVATFEEDEADIREDNWGALEDRISIPPQFDSREQWPSCIHPIRDQGSCGSCWAFSAAEVLSDRFCIEKQVEVVLSPQWLVNCNRRNFGCSGGYLNRAWTFLKREGVAADSCLPYSSGVLGDDFACPSTCEDGSPVQLYTAFQVKKYIGIKQMQLALMQAGPLQTTFAVYTDFVHYRRGIYTHVGGKLLGIHAVKIIGWGQDNGTNYWVAANSWGADWGEEGYFRIAFDQVGINRRGLAGRANQVVG